mmetsp:Transcript_83459/g.183442  ORF Transcript_83459/g.183442 Transcript_83459/m.183442 type:complete len:525 (+) Transcript_83459:194-1768(+)
MQASGIGGLSLDVPQDLIKDPRLWTVDDIQCWLHWLGIGEHAGTFAARGVDGVALLQLSAGGNAAWGELGVLDPAQQQVLNSAVEPLCNFRDSDGTRSSLALHAIEGPVAGEVFFIGSDGITGGRHSASNSIVLPENYVSRRHFHISCSSEGRFLLEDVGSTTGTFLMVKELVLRDEMVLQIGTTELGVMISGSTCTIYVSEGPDRDVRASIQLGEALVIGREASPERNGLCIRDPQISAYHCEIHSAPSRGQFILEDRFSTNRTWLRLAPDGQQSRTFPIAAGDLFKVGSTLFHVVDAASMLPHDLHEGGDLGIAGNSSMQADLPPGLMFRTVRAVEDHDNEDDGLSPRAELSPGNSDDAAPSDHHHDLHHPLTQSPEDSPQVSPIAGPTLRWEHCHEDEMRPTLDPQDYARQLTAARRRALMSQVQESATGLHNLHEQALSSLQQRMTDVRAQTAYTLQQQRPDGSGPVREEDLCKICYDRAINITLLPCGHFVLCAWCAQRVSECPICRTVIADIIRTYRA